MIEPDRVLQPLDTRPTIDERLREYDSAEALAAAVRDAADALERSLRLLLRSDRGATDADRVHALSPAELPHERLIERLRQRELISIELAGLSHQTHAARTRAEAGTARADPWFLQMPWPRLRRRRHPTRMLVRAGALP